MDFNVFFQFRLEKLEKQHLFVELRCIVLDLVSVCNLNYQIFTLHELHDFVFLCIVQDAHCFSDQYIKMNGKKVTKQTFFVEDWSGDPDLKDRMQKDKNKANTLLLVNLLWQIMQMIENIQRQLKKYKTFLLLQRNQQIAQLHLVVHKRKKNKRWIYMYIMLML